LNVTSASVFEGEQTSIHRSAYSIGACELFLLGLELRHAIDDGLANVRSFVADRPLRPHFAAAPEPGATRCSTVPRIPLGM
jgi:hypothetical protein